MANTTILELSDREKYVLALASVGCDDNTISLRLNKVEGRIAGNWKRIFHKYKVSTRNDAIERYLDYVKGVEDSKEYSSPIPARHQGSFVISNRIVFAALRTAYGLFVKNGLEEEAVSVLLTCMLHLTSSTFGFISRVHPNLPSALACEHVNLINVTWDDHEKVMYRSRHSDGRRLVGVDRLLAEVFQSRNSHVADADRAVRPATAETATGNGEDQLMAIPLKLKERVVGAVVMGGWICSEGN